MRLVLLSAVAAGALAAVPAAPAESAVFHRAVDPSQFPVPDNLAAAVRFWRSIFSQYSSNEIVIHDDEHLDIVYGVVDVTDLYTGSLSDTRASKQREQRVRDEMRRWETVLRHLGGDSSREVEPQDVARVAQLFEAVPGGRSRYRSAIHRLRPQTGQKDRFGEAIKVAGMFMPDIERIMREHKIPIELARLPFVESMFNYKARSKVGASGAWQFTSDSARLAKMRVDSAVDERLDVLLAAEGAARKLTNEFDRLGTWPITITAYNHGFAGMARAVRHVGSPDIGEIVDKYSGRSFGFASRNFYAEFVAAVTVFADREELFPDVEPLPAIRFEEFTAPSFTSLRDLATLANVEVEALAELNPALSDMVVAGRLLLPTGYKLRVPPGTLASFQNAYADIPDDRKLDRQLATRYRVQRGDTLSSVAQRFGTSAAALQRANQLTRPDRIYIGQMLEIPNGGRDSLPPLDPNRARSPATASETAADAPGSVVHTVRAGETLWAIAQKYGASIDAIVAANNLSSAHLVQAGQRLSIPQGAVVSYTVRSGDTLSTIATAHGSTVRSIMDANQLSSTTIRPGQVLRVPVS